MLNHVFTTPIWRGKGGLSTEELSTLREYLAGWRSNAPGDTKSNRGGWHSTGNLFGPEYRQFPFMRDAVTKAIFAYLGDICEYRGELQLALTGWTVINRPGDYNVPHNHAANLLSGALYVTIPADMRGGAIVFQDPRLNLNAHFTEAMEKLGINPPWAKTSISVIPAVGEILVFPSWLVHFVEPFQCDEKYAERIVVSFNATIQSGS